MFDIELESGLELPGSVERDGSHKLRCQTDGCPHLSDGSQDRCQVYDHRPKACRHFPFRGAQTPGGTYIGASFACTAIQLGQGPALESDSQDWHDLPVIDFHPPLSLDAPLTACPWSQYQKLEEYLADQLCYPDGAFSAAVQLSLALSQGRLQQLGAIPLAWLSEDIEAACQRTLRGLLALMESHFEEAQARQLLDAQLRGGRYWSPAFGCWVEPRKVHQRMSEGPDEHWKDVEPFFRHLLFRKFLWGAPSVHARVCLLPLLNEILRYWSWQQALAQGGVAGKAHRLGAIRELERRLTFHAFGWEDCLSSLSRAFLRGVS